jgi:hypothetical protein
MQATQARKQGERTRVRWLRQQAQRLPSRDPNDPHFRRLWYVRYADDFLLGLAGPKSEAEAVKNAIATFLREELHLALHDEKTLITHARDDKAKFLGYEVHILHSDSKQDRRRQRCINGSVGLRIPRGVRQAKCAQYLRHGGLDGQDVGQQISHNLHQDLPTLWRDDPHGRWPLQGHPRHGQAPTA